MCRFFVVPGNGQALLGILDIETLDVLTVNCNTKHMQNKECKSTIRQKTGSNAKRHKGNRQD